jgi:hypothetical protein
MQKFNVIIPTNVKPYPEDHEVSAAAILADHFQSDIIFAKRHLNSPTADLRVATTGIAWEVKSPKGNSKRTIQNNLRLADNQSENVVMDMRRSKMYYGTALSRIRHELGKAHKIMRLLVITKTGSVIVIK